MNFDEEWSLSLEKFILRIFLAVGGFSPILPVFWFLQKPKNNYQRNQLQTDQLQQPQKKSFWTNQKLKEIHVMQPVSMVGKGGVSNESSKSTRLMFLVCWHAAQ